MTKYTVHVVSKSGRIWTTHHHATVGDREVIATKAKAIGCTIAWREERPRRRP